MVVTSRYFTVEAVFDDRSRPHLVDKFIKLFIYVLHARFCCSCTTNGIDGLRSFCGYPDGIWF